MKQNKSIIDRYFDYMRDSWCEEECRTIFGTRAASVWKVWCRSIAPDLCGAARRFYIALDRGNRRLLIEQDKTRNAFLRSRVSLFVRNAARVRYR